VPLRHAVSAAADRFSLDGRLTKLFVALCFPEVARYLAADDAPARVQAREHVAATIADRRGRVVIAHSLGTVVAYEALYARPDLEVGLLVPSGRRWPCPVLSSPACNPGPAAASACVRSMSGGGSTSATTATRSPSCGPSRPTSPFPDVDLDLTESVGLFDFHRAARYLACASLAATRQPLIQRT